MNPVRRLSLLVLLLAGCGAPASKPADWAAFRDGFLEAYFRAEPGFAVYQGRHEFDGKLPDWSEAGWRGWIQELHGWRDSAEKFPLPAAASDDAWLTF